MKSGKRKVFAGLLPLVAVCAMDAGREGESGSGALRVAPELVAPTGDALPCGQVAGLRSRELVFEILDPAGLDPNQPQLRISVPRELVDFEWNPVTGELRYTATAGTSVFSDLALATQASAANHRSCGSR